MTETQEHNLSMLKALSSECFNVESKLPMFDTFDMENASPEQFIRQSLYRVRIDLNNILRYYQQKSSDAVCLPWGNIVKEENDN